MKGNHSIKLGAVERLEDNSITTNRNTTVYYFNNDREMWKNWLSDGYRASHTFTPRDRDPATVKQAT